MSKPTLDLTTDGREVKLEHDAVRLRGGEGGSNNVRPADDNALVSIGART